MRSFLEGTDGKFLSVTMFEYLRYQESKLKMEEVIIVANVIWLI